MASVASRSASHGLEGPFQRVFDSERFDTTSIDTALDIFGNSVIKRALKSCDESAELISAREGQFSATRDEVKIHHKQTHSNAHVRNNLIAHPPSPIMAGGSSLDTLEPHARDVSASQYILPGTSVEDVISKDHLIVDTNCVHHNASTKPFDTIFKALPSESGRRHNNAYREKTVDSCDKNLGHCSCEVYSGKTKKKKIRTKGSNKWKAVDLTELGFDFPLVSRLQHDGNITNDVDKDSECDTIREEEKMSKLTMISESDAHAGHRASCDEKDSLSSVGLGEVIDCCSGTGNDNLEDAEYFLSLGIDVFNYYDDTDCDAILEWDDIAFEMEKGASTFSNCSAKKVSKNGKGHSHTNAPQKNEQHFPSTGFTPVLDAKKCLLKKCDKNSLYELECTSRKKVYIRRDKHRRVEKAHKAVKSKNCKSIFNNRGRKALYMHHRLVKMHNLSLDFRSCQRQGRVPPMPKSVMDPLAAKAVFKVNRTTTGKQGGNFHSAPAQNLRHTLHETNAPSHLDMDLASFLISLQHREMTPEDYDMLLRLDDTVKPKTVSKGVLDNFKMDTVGPGEPSDAEILCSICMECYISGDKRKFLPCGHVFHAACVDTWLKNSSMNCPLDGLPVDAS
ncbi:RING Zinc finger-containing protein [Plakobranchus ocellatus]|uniref:RING Zinc finger-containing protein n=1 Tax=Plakobranchus ocellatus TaxID=259542 RepID=A0AAV4AEM8_9GAST|nr:RING Zinc finger-containing protein [Plakobranchus ocellatus]